MRRSDLALRGLALAIALALFVIVRGERRVTVVYVVPAQAVLPERTVPAAPLPEEVTVAINAPWSGLRLLEPEKLGAVRIDLSRSSPGPAAWHVRTEALHLPRGARVESITPAQGTIELRRDVR